MNDEGKTCMLNCVRLWLSFRIRQFLSTQIQHVLYCWQENTGTRTFFRVDQPVVHVCLNLNRNKRQRHANVHGHNKTPKMVYDNVHGHHKTPKVVYANVHRHHKTPKVVYANVHGHHKTPKVVYANVHGHHKTPKVVYANVHGHHKSSKVVYVQDFQGGLCTRLSRWFMHFNSTLYLQYTKVIISIRFNQHKSMIKIVVCEGMGILLLQTFRFFQREC